MKTRFLFSSLMLLALLLALNVTYAGQRHSVAAGGNWGVAATWVENAVPTQNDTVIITGPGTVNVSAVNQKCALLIVNTGAILRNNSGYNYELTVTYDVNNYGTITNSSGNLNIKAGGNITNEGIMENNRITLNGTVTQTISCPSGYTIDLDELTDLNAASGTNFNTPIEFNGTIINMASAACELLGTPSGHDFIIHGGQLTAINLSANDLCIYQDQGTRLETNTTISNVTLAGKTIIGYTGVVLTGEVIIQDTLRNEPGYGYSLSINGNVRNYGVFFNNSGTLSVNISGDIYNYGTFGNNAIVLNGSGLQRIYESGGVFKCGSFTVATASGPVSLESDVHFMDCNVDFNNDTLIIAPPKSGGTIISLNDGSLAKTVVSGHSGDRIYMKNSAYLSNNAHLINMTLTGIVRTYFNGITFKGTTIIQDTLRNLEGYSVTVTVKDSLYIAGSIINSSGNLSLNCEGDICNNGIPENYAVYLTGTGDQHLISMNLKPFKCNFFTDNNPLTGNIISDGDLSFYSTLADFDGSNLYMPSGKKIILGGDPGNPSSLRNTRIKGADFFWEMTGNGYMRDINCESSVVFNGVIKIYGTCNFNNYIVSTDTLRNLEGYGSTLNVGGRLTNDGVIINSSGTLTINCQGDIVNNGLWENYLTILNGTQNQFLFLIGHQPIIGTVRFTVPSGQSPYQWYYDGSVLNSPDFSGENSNTLGWLVSVQQSWYGDYHCMSNTGQSRIITVGGGLLADIKVFLEGPFSGTEMNNSLNTSNYIPLNQPYSGSPWNYSGSESVTSLPANVVDWVLVEFRETAGGPETASPATMVARQAGFLLKNGRIVRTDGINEMQFDFTVSDNLYPVIWHRNHLAVISSVPVVQTGIAYQYDFTGSSSQAYGGITAHKEIGTGVWGMMSGDGNSDGTISNTDKNNVWKVQAGQSGYKQGDLNMNGQVENADKNDSWRPNSGKSSQVPE